MFFDHSVAVSRLFDKEKTEMFAKMFGNTVLVDYHQPVKTLFQILQQGSTATAVRNKTA